MLQRLIAYADRIDPQPINYALRRVHWVVDVNAQGEWGETPWVAMKKNFRHRVPFIERQGPPLQPLLLFDKVDYALGVALGTNPQKALAKHHAFRRLVEACAEQTGQEDVRAVATALSRDRRPPVPGTMKATDWVLFRVDGRFPVDRPSVQTYWARSTKRDAGREGYQCLACGEPCRPMERHRVPIPLPGGHAKGTKLISANDSAYASYGLSESLVAPTCEECARKYAVALCHLIDAPEGHLTIGKATYVFFAQAPTPLALSLLENPSQEGVQTFLQTHGEPLRNAMGFYAAVLSPNVSRIVVRDWTETTVGEVENHLAAWFRKQRLIGVDGYVSLRAMAASLGASAAKNLSEEIQPAVVTHLIQHAIYARPLPRTILLQALRRNAAEPARIKFTPARLALCKVYLLQTARFREDELVALEETRVDPGYRCGRLFAEVERIQTVANGNSAAPWVDRYYGLAAATPASVFPALLRSAQSHLRGIQTEKYTLATTLGRELEAMTGVFREVPRCLAPEEQALFALGYYHQRRHLRDQIHAIVAAREGSPNDGHRS